MARVGMCAVLACALASGAAHADTVKVKRSSSFFGQGTQVDVKLYSGGTHSYNNLFAGQLNHSLSDGVGPMGQRFEGERITFCCDLLGSYAPSSSSTTYDVKWVGEMFNAEKAGALRDIYRGAQGQQLDPTVDDKFAAAFQIVVWEIVYDYDPSKTNANIAITSTSSSNGVSSTNRFRAWRSNGYSLTGDSALWGYVNEIVGYIRPSGQHISSSALCVLKSSNYQDQLIIPLPGAAAMGLAGLGLAGAARRRRA